MRSKKKQKSSSKTDFVNLKPTWVDSTSKTPKRNYEAISTDEGSGTGEGSSTGSITPDQKLNALNQEMNRRLTNKVNKCIEIKGDLGVLKTTCLALKQLERGTVSNAEIAAGLPTSVITNFIKNRSKPNIQYWVEYVEENFDRIAEEAKKSGESSSTASKKPATVVKPIIHKDILRACTRNFNSLVRADIDDDRHVPPHIKKICLDSEDFDKEIKKLFGFSHLQYVQSTYFGLQGIKESTLKANPIHAALVKILPRPDTQPDLDNYAMKIALQTYATNFETMWANKKRFTKGLNKLLIVLLRHHLAPIRERKRKVYIEELKRNNKDDASKEDDVDMELEILAENNAKAEAQLRENEEDEIFAETQDTTRTRLKSLVSVLRQVIFQSHGETITEKKIGSECKDIDQRELKAFEIILGCIMPYIPSKDHWFDISYQIPFVLMANEIFQVAQYTKFCFNICPLTMPGHLMSLKLHSRSLFVLLCSTRKKGRKALEVYDFEGRPIPSGEAAVENKDAVFGSFFNLPYIKDYCRSNGLEFSQYLVIKPGLKIVRIIGKLIKHPSPCNCNPQSETPTRPSAPVNFKEAHDLERCCALLQADIAANKQLLDSLITERKRHQLETQIKVLKSSWIKSSEPLSATDILKNNDTYNLIQAQKSIKNKLDENIRLGRTKLSNLKQELYNLTIFLRQNKDIQRKKKSNITTDQVQEKSIIRKGSKCLVKAEDIQFEDDLIDDNKTTFGGTDNGIVTFTETSKFDIKKFEYHIKLYNRFSVLSEEQDTSIPKTHKIKGKEIDRASGAAKIRRHFISQKKDGLGKQVQENELIDSQLNLGSVKDHHEIERIFQQHLQHQDSHRQFYYSKRNNRISQRYEYQRRRYIYRLCSIERQHVGKRPVLFVGDRGYGINSPIKGHMKCGGPWKAEKHSMYIPVIVTNEHNTSQTCIFCFHKLSHPKKVIDKNGKSYTRSVNGTNKDCVLVKAGASHKSRDSLSALAIGISGLATVLFGQPLPVFNPKQNIRSSNTDINTSATVFLKRNIVGHASTSHSVSNTRRGNYIQLHCNFI